MKRILCILIIIFISLTLNSCSGGRKDTGPSDSDSGIPTDKPTAGNTPTSSPVKPSQYAMNPLTGLYNMSKDNIGKRPLAITINNLKIATPQYGIGSADLYYECVAEGGITRILAMFADVDKIPDVGPVRSARHYFVDFSQGHDALFAHYGASYIAKDLLKSKDIDDIDGMTSNDVYWRDPVLKRTKGTEHSALTNGQKLWAGINKRKLRTDLKDKNMNAFNFLPEEDFKAPSDKQCAKVTVPFSGYVTAVFQYNPETKLYYKSQFDAPHTDAVTKKQIAVTNVVLLYTDIKQIGSTILMDVNLKEGVGYYISGGGAKSIKWSKGTTFDPLKLSDANGSPLSVNAGKTYICVLGNTRVSHVVME